VSVLGPFPIPSLLGPSPLQAGFGDIVVTDYGATGNGTSDDTEAVLLAVSAACHQGGATVFFPPGHYLCSEAIVLCSGVRLTGAGATLACPSFSNQAGLVQVAPGATDVELDHLAFNMTAPQTPAIAFIVPANRLSVHDCTFTGSGAASPGTWYGYVSVGNGASDVVIAANRFHDIAAGSNFPICVGSSTGNANISSNILITRNQFRSVYGHAVFFQSNGNVGTLVGISVRGNNAFDCKGDAPGTGQYGGLVGDSASSAYCKRNLSICQNTIYYSPATNNTRRAGVMVYSTTDVVIADNTCTVDPATTDPGLGDGMMLAIGRLSGPNIGCTIVGNVLDGNYLMASIDWDSTTDTVIAANTWRQTTVAGSLGYATQTRVRYTGNVSYNSSVTGAGPPGAINMGAFTAAVECVIAGNTYVDDRATPVTTVAVQYQNGGTDTSGIQISDNYVAVPHGPVTTVQYATTPTTPGTIQRLTVADTNGLRTASGALTVAVPGSGSAVAASAFNRMFHISQATAASTVVISGGPTIPVPVGSTTAVFVPAGHTLTPTYTTAPTWVVEGL
jgi:Pectate lyase superfamily protein